MLPCDFLSDTFVFCIFDLLSDAKDDRSTCTYDLLYLREEPTSQSRDKRIRFTLKTVGIFTALVLLFFF